MRSLIRIQDKNVSTIVDSSRRAVLFVINVDKTYFKSFPNSFIPDLCS